MSDNLKRFLLDVNKDGHVTRGRYKTDFDAVAKDYNLTPAEMDMVKKKDIAGIQTAVGASYAVVNDPKNFIHFSAKP